MAAGSGPEALAAAAEHRPSAVVLDVMMPGMDGFEVCRRLKSDPATAAIPVIFLTASAGGDFRRRAFAHGAADFLAKPYQMSDLPVYLSAILDADGYASGTVAHAPQIIAFVRANDFPDAVTPVIRLTEAIPLYHRRPVTLIDLELPAGSIGARLQLAGGPNIRHLLHDDGEPLATTVARVAQRYHAGVRVIPAPFSPPPDDRHQPDTTRLSALLDFLKREGDDVVLYLGAGIGAAAEAALRRADIIGVIAQSETVANDACARLRASLAAEAEAPRVVPVAVSADARQGSVNRARQRAWHQEPYLSQLAGIAF